MCSRLKMLNKKNYLINFGRCVYQPYPIKCIIAISNHKIDSGSGLVEVTTSNADLFLNKAIQGIEANSISSEEFRGFRIILMGLKWCK